MKTNNILMVSAVAIMAVASANADIASTAYVGTAVGGVETKLTAGASGYNINANTLKVKGADVLTSHNPIDDALSDSSTNAVQNKVVKAALDAKQATIDADHKLPASNVSGLANVATSGSYADLSGTPTIDSSFVADSTNAVQSKVVKAALDAKQATIDADHKLSKDLVSGLGTAAASDASAFAPASHNQASSTINAMTGYTKASTAAAIAATDSLNTAIGKLEKSLDGKQATIDADHKLPASNVSGLATVATTGSYNNLSDKPTIDSALSDSSTNAVQNKVVKAALGAKQNIQIGVAGDAGKAVVVNSEGKIGMSANTLGSAAYTDSTAYDAAGAATTAAGNVETKLTAGATGYDINAKTLKVQGTDVLTTSSNLAGGKLNAGTVAKTALASGVQSSLDKADSAVQSVVAGDGNGQIKVDGTNVSVTGLGSAAYTASTDYAPSAMKIATNITSATAMTDGDYILTAKVVDGNVTYGWENIGR